MAKYSYKKQGELVEVELTREQEAEKLGKRKALSIFIDRIESVLNDPDIGDEDFAQIFRAYFNMRLYGVKPEFSDRFIRKTFEGLASGDEYIDQQYIKTCLKNKSNSEKAGRPPKDNGNQEEQEADDP